MNGGICGWFLVWLHVCWNGVGIVRLWYNFCYLMVCGMGYGMLCFIVFCPS
eukprot:jgi/Botrbrau1/17781/Bobra.0127s0034.1